MRSFILIILVTETLLTCPTVAQTHPTLVLAYGTECQHGLHQQPGDGPFAVMLFCDDALGTHLGVICYQPDIACFGAPWNLADRFWQKGVWGSDVTAFAWDKNGKCLYVSTSEVYGSGDLFALNLVTRRTKTVPLKFNGRLVNRGRYTTTLKAMDTSKNQLTYELEYFDSISNQTAQEIKTLRLPACGE